MELPEAVFEGLEAYFELLRKWNRRVALTSLSVLDYSDQAIDRLLVEPAVAAQYLPDPHASVIDIGSGGGSPAIPMKVVVPAISMVMVESRQRKAAFLRESVRHLGLSRMSVEAVRSQDLAEQPEFKGSADVVTLRAVKVDDEMLASAAALLKMGGVLFLFSSASQPRTGGTANLLPLRVHPLLAHQGSALEILRRIN